MLPAQPGHANTLDGLTFSPRFIRVRRKNPPYTDMPGFKNA
jgi:hypothetical protein